MNKLTDKALFNYTNIFCTLLEFEIYLYILQEKKYNFYEKRNECLSL